MRVILACVAASLLGASPIRAQQPTPAPTLVALARAELAGPARALWPGWDRTPFGVLLIDGTTERLLCHPSRPAGFTDAGLDPATGCQALTRPRRFPPGLLAAMPAFGPPSTVVIGVPAATGKDEAAWRATLLHEHFHQHQSGFPGYYDGVKALGLSGGDQTGMWMLNYAFPYADTAVAAKFAALAAALGMALKTDGPPRAALTAHLTQRDALAAAVSPQDWRYLEFQLWQEGVARWTEMEAAARSDDPALRAAGARLRRSTLDQLAAADLPRNGRVALYALGAGEAMLLDRCGARWKARYPAVLATRPLLQAALEDCPDPERRG